MSALTLSFLIGAKHNLHLILIPNAKNALEGGLKKTVHTKKSIYLLCKWFLRKVFMQSIILSFLEKNILAVKQLKCDLYMYIYFN